MIRAWLGSNTNASTAVQTAGVDVHRAEDHLAFELGDVLAALMPAKVTAKVKRQMRREMRKPVDMKVRAHSQNLIRINMDDIPVLPPFVQHQELSSDELLDILLHGMPCSWQNEMERQGFDPIKKGYFATIDFMENLEGLEQKKETSSSSKDKKATSKSKKDLAAFLAKSAKDQVKAGVKKELAALGKKHKTKSDDEDQECALVEMFEKNLDGFNCDKMDNLSVKSEVSC